MTDCYTDDAIASIIRQFEAHPDIRISSVSWEPEAVTICGVILPQGFRFSSRLERSQLRDGIAEKYRIKPFNWQPKDEKQQ